MNIQKTLYSLFLLSFLMAFMTNFTACGNSSSNGSTTATAPAAPGAAPVVPAAVACAAGQVPTQYGCLATVNCYGPQAGYGFYPATNSCYPPSVGAGTPCSFSQTGRWSAGIVGINRRLLEQLLTDWGLCNRYNIANWGAENCNRYSSAAFISVVYSGGASAYVQLSAGVSNPAYIYLMNYAAGGAYNGGYGNGILSLNTSLQIAANGATGMQLMTGFNPSYFSSADQGLGITAANENFNNNTMNLTITYAGQTLGVANATRN